MWGEGGPLLVVRQTDTLVLVNQDRTRTVGAAVVAEGALVLLAPCSTWTPIPPEGERIVPHDEVIAWSDGADAVEIHWCVQPGGKPAGILRVRF
jgi:hypothetical protein